MTRQSKGRVFDTVASLTIGSLLPLVVFDLAMGCGTLLAVFETLIAPVHRWSLDDDSRDGPDAEGETERLARRP